MNLLEKLGKKKTCILIAIDVLIIIFSYIAIQVFVRDTFKIYGETLIRIIKTVVEAVIVYESLFYIIGLYRNITRFESGKDYLKYAIACVSSGLIISIGNMIFKTHLLGIRHNVVTSLIIAIGVISYRVIIRYYLIFEKPIETEEDKKPTKKNLLVIGAGYATKDMITSIKTRMRNTYNIVGLIDDDREKIGCTILGVEVLGNRNDIVSICKKKKVEVIFFSISNINPKDRKEIIEICQHTGAKVRILPSVQDLIKNKKLLDNLRDVEIEDLLGREPIKLDNENITDIIKNKVILVTGGGGSIGSELCRQVASFNPKQLVIFDIYENNLYNIQMELNYNYPNLDVQAIVGSVRDKKKLDNLFNTYKPEIVFHAAAHKHVPLMEASPLEAIKNNVFGTYNTVEMSEKYKVKKFILVSTDKAVNPTNIMGASKRLCEMIIQSKDKVSNTKYVAVRFGNVLGSNGSVVPLFKKQIEKGGPVTVTHKDIIRYFMTIPEAVSLILQATTYAEGGEIFVLDMGEPVKIYDLAVSLIKLSGLEPNVDIPIKFTGLRPGEKLFEELLMAEEGLNQTEHKKIFIAQPGTLTIDELHKKLNVLENLIQDETVSFEKIRETVKQVVPTYHEPVIKEMKKEQQNITGESIQEIYSEIQNAEAEPVQS